MKVATGEQTCLVLFLINVIEVYNLYIINCLWAFESNFSNDN